MLSLSVMDLLSNMVIMVVMVVIKKYSYRFYFNF